MKLPDIECGKRFFLGEGRPIALGIGNDEIRGSAYMEGPVQMGTASEFSSVLGTLMIARETNSDDKNQPPRSLYVKGNTRLEGDGGTDHALNVSGGKGAPLKVDGDGIFTALSPSNLTARFGVADQKGKTFDIVNPTKKEGHRLRYACIEGPEIGVYYRGRLKNDTEIVLPYYWKDLVHTDSITVQLQPIGAHQDIIVKRWDAEKIYLQAKPGFPINCFYHVYAERKDVNPLIVEYAGNTCFDYPDPNYTTIEESERVFNDPQYAGPRNTITI